MTHATDTIHRTDASPGETLDSIVIYGSPELDIAGAQGLYGNLLTAMQARQPVIFDMAQVERIDTAVLQMLCAFVRDAQAIGLPVHWRQASPSLRNAARLLDVEACLSLPVPSQRDDRGTTANLEKQ